jgi:hypothetical protein
MKRALIPAVFVVCGAFASVAWRTVELPCQVSRLEIASAIASPILRCLANELFTHELALTEASRGGQVAEQLCGSRDAARALLFEILVSHAFDRAGSRINSVGVSISSWLVRHTVGSAVKGKENCNEISEHL